MLITSTMPTEGQFIATWKQHDMLWSSTLRWHEGVLHIFVNTLGGFTLLNIEHPIFNHSIYFIISEDSDEDLPTGAPENESVH